MSGTFCWCVSGAWAYLSCVFYVVSDVRCSQRACSTGLSVQIVATSPVTELLSRFNYVLRENWQKKTYPCSWGRYLMPHFWIITLFIDMSHHALVMRLADYVIFSEFVLNGVPVVFSFLPSCGMICQKWQHGLGGNSMVRKVPNGHSCNIDLRVED